MAETKAVFLFCFPQLIMDLISDPFVNKVPILESQNVVKEGF